MMLGRESKGLLVYRCVSCFAVFTMPFPFESSKVLVNWIQEQPPIPISCLGFTNIAKRGGGPLLSWVEKEAN